MPKKNADIKYFESVGRRKEAVARVRLYIVGKDKTATVNGKKIKEGEIIVNEKPINVDFPLLVHEKRYLKPLMLTNNQGRYAISIMVSGGGPNGQLEAIMHGISRAIEISDAETRPVLKEAGLLTRDPRTRERRMVGTGGRARRQKQSPKR
ncbi:30S ribosomal protein S9 [soil metagenome]